MSDKDIFTQDELNNLEVNETISLQQEVQNLAILAKNELGDLVFRVGVSHLKTSQCNHFRERHSCQNIQIQNIKKSPRRQFPS